MVQFHDPRRPSGLPSSSDLQPRSPRGASPDPTPPDPTLDQPFTSGQSRISRTQLLHVQFVRFTPTGEEEVIAQTKPSRGGNHLNRILSLLDELLSVGYTSDMLLTLHVRTFRDGVQETEFPIDQGSLRIVEERRARTLL